MKNLISSTRMIKRSQDLQNEKNPEVVITKLQTLLKEAIVMQASGSKFFADRALKEIKFIRNELARGQINGGAKTAHMTMMYGQIIDQMEDITKQAAKTQGNMDKAIGTIKAAFPSVDTLVGALMTANPVMGYGVKVFRDIMRSRKEAKAKDLAEKKKRLATLKEQEALIEKQVDLTEAQEKVAEEQKTEIKEKKRESKKGGLYRPILEEIKKEISDLKASIHKSETVEPTYNGASAAEQLSLFAQLETEKVVEDLAEVEKENADKIVDAIHEIVENDQQERKEEKRKSKLTRVSGTNKMYTAPEAVAHQGTKEKDGGPFASILGFMRVLTMLGAIGGTAGLLSTLIAPIGALFSFLGSLGGMLVRMMPALALPAVIITAIYEFLDGFFNAAEILGKPENQVSIGDRILVGVSNVFGAVARLFDYLLELIGIDIFDTTDITKKIYEFFMSIPENVTRMVDAIAEQIERSFDEAVGTVTKVYDKIVVKFVELYDAITGKLDKWINDFKNTDMLSWMTSMWGDEDTGTVSPATPFKAPGSATFNPFVDSPSARTNAVRSMDSIATQVIQEKAKQQTGAVGINAPTANVTSVNNTIMRDRPTNNSNPRYRMALG